MKAWFVGRDLKKYLRLNPRWRLIECSWFTASKVRDTGWWEFYLVVENKEDVLETTNAWLFYNPKTKQFRGYFTAEIFPTLRSNKKDVPILLNRQK